MKSLRIGIASIIFATAALVASSALAQTKGNATLSGKVVDDQGQPVPDASVVAVMVGQSEPASTRTDKKGEWKIKDLREGQWRVEVAKEGLETNRQVVLDAIRRVSLGVPQQ